ncbi:MAG: TetR/AcrR family transcriptional regulator [Pseudomonadales bacterium]
MGQNTAQGAAEITLIEALNQLFIGVGFADLTVADIARALRCSKRTLYQLAKSKTQLVTTVVEYNFNKRLRESKSVVFQHSEPAVRLDAYFTLVRNRNDQRSGSFFADVIADSDLNQIRLRYLRQQLEVLEMIIEDGMKSGVFRTQNPQLSTEFSLGMLTTISQPDLIAALHTEYTELFDQGVDILRHGIWAEREASTNSASAGSIAQSAPAGDSMIDRIEQLFESEGFAHFTMLDLTRRFNCSKRALYAVASSKEDLLKQVVQRNYERHYSNTKSAVYKENTPGGRLAAYFSVIHHRNRRRNHQFLADVINLPGPNQIRLLHVQQMLSLLENILSDGISQGVFRNVDPALTSAIAFGLLNGVESAYSSQSEGLDYATVFDQAVNLFQYGVLAPAQA